MCQLPIPRRGHRFALAGLLLACLVFVAGCRHSSFPEFPEGYREFAYVANAGSNTVSILDLVYLRPDRTLQVGADPTVIAVNPARNEVYVLNSQPESAAGSLTIIDTTRNQVAATIALHRNPTALAVDPGGHRAYVVNTGSNNLSVVDLDARRVSASAPTGDKPSGIRLAPDKRTLAVTNSADGTVNLFALDPKGTLSLRTTIAGCPLATSPVILPDSSKAFVACAGSHQVLAISLAADPASQAFRQNARQDAGLLRDHLLATLDVGRNPTYLTLKPDGGEVFVSNSAANSLSEIATYTNEVGNTQPIGDHPTQGIVSADGSLLWIADSGADSLSLYSIEDGKLVVGLRTGNAPSALAFSAEENLVLAANRDSGDVALIRTTSQKGGAALFTLMPAGKWPVAIAIKAMPHF